MQHRAKRQRALHSFFSKTRSGVLLSQSFLDPSIEFPLLLPELPL
jgi:hypothetical protein